VNKDNYLALSLLKTNPGYAHLKPTYRMSHIKYYKYFDNMRELYGGVI